MEKKVAPKGSANDKYGINMVVTSLENTNCVDIKYTVHQKIPTNHSLYSDNTRKRQEVSLEQ